MVNINDTTPRATIEGAVDLAELRSKYWSAYYVTEAGARKILDSMVDKGQNRDDYRIVTVRGIRAIAEQEVIIPKEMWSGDHDLDLATRYGDDDLPSGSRVIKVAVISNLRLDRDYRGEPVLWGVTTLAGAMYAVRALDGHSLMWHLAPLSRYPGRVD